MINFNVGRIRMDMHTTPQPFRIFLVVPSYHASVIYSPGQLYTCEVHFCSAFAVIVGSFPWVLSIHFLPCFL
jgi:hypothetical protein